MDAEKRIERVKAIYNDCWIVYKKFLETHDMRQYSQDVCDLRKKYGGGHDIDGLVMWFMPIVNNMQKDYFEEMKKSEYKTGTAGFTGNEE